MAGEVIELRPNWADSQFLPQRGKGAFPSSVSQMYPGFLCQSVWAWAKIVAKAVSEDSSEISMTEEVGGVVEGAPGMSRRPASSNCCLRKCGFSDVK